jgi:hypothetical protein
VTKRTEAYKAKLPDRCKARPAPPVGDFGPTKECLDNPLAKGCK